MYIYLYKFTPCNFSPWPCIPTNWSHHRLYNTVPPSRRSKKWSYTPRNLLFVRDMTHSYMWHDSCTSVTWLIRNCDMTPSYVWHDSFTCVTWRIYMYGVTDSYAWHDAFICVTWLIHVCAVTHSYVWHDSFICVLCHIHKCGMAIIIHICDTTWFI